MLAVVPLRAKNATVRHDSHDSTTMTVTSHLTHTNCTWRRIKTYFEVGSCPAGPMDSAWSLRTLEPSLCVCDLEEQSNNLNAGTETSIWYNVLVE